MDIKGELSYRWEVGKYYLGTAWDKVRALPTVAQGLLLLLLLALLFGGFQALAGGGGAEDPSPGAAQTQAPVDSSPAEVPDLKFVKRSEAFKQLQERGFTNIDAQQIPQFADNSQEEVILEQAPEAGTTMPKTERVTIRYGSQDLFNRQNVKKAIPSTKGILLSKALEVYKREGFTNISYNLPGGRREREYVVTASTPAPGTSAPLGAKITVSITPGMNLNLFEDSLRITYIPYAKFAKLENPKARVVKVTLKQFDKTLTTPEAMNEAARLYKVGMEQVVGENLDQVLLVNPSVGFVGDSLQALRDTTSDGLTVDVARKACEAKAQENFSSVEIDWAQGRQSEQVKANRILLAVAAKVVAEDESVQNVIVKCEVGGNSETPEVMTFQAN